MSKRPSSDKIKYWEILAYEKGWRKVKGLVVSLDSDRREWLDQLFPKTAPRRGSYELMLAVEGLHQIVNIGKEWNCSEEEWEGLEDLAINGRNEVWYTKPGLRHGDTLGTGSKVIVLRKGS